MMTDKATDQDIVCLPPIEDGKTREHFIPVRQADLVENLVNSLSENQRQRFIDLSQLLAATFHYEFHRRMEKMKDAYALLDPDRDTRVVAENGSLTPEKSSSQKTSSNQAAARFFADTIELLERANFFRLDRAHIEEAIEAASDWGVNLEVDFNLFERLEVFSRGDVLATRTRRRLRNFRRAEQVEVPVYQRLVVVFQLRADHKLTGCADPNRVYLKLFKNIPKMDLDMLLPGTRVKMTRFDQGKIILPTLSGIALALVKIIKGVALLATATASGMLSFLGILGGTIGYGVKSFLGYLRTKDKYQLNLTRSLYFQNLDNNAGVLFRLLDEAEEQEVREALLAWYLLWQQAPSEGWTEAELDRAAEVYLEQQFAVQVDFEIDDALAKLQRLGLSRCDSQGRLTAIGLAEALVVLDRAWDNLFQYHDEEEQRRAA
jgi:hypothetical protein